MLKYTDPSEREIRSAASNRSVTPENNGKKQSFIDGRPEAAVQRKIKELADISSKSTIQLGKKDKKNKKPDPNPLRVKSSAGKRKLRNTQSRIMRGLPPAGNRSGTRAYKARNTKLKEVQKHGFEPIPDPPTNVNGRLVFNGHRSSLRFWKSTELIVYGRYPVADANNRIEYQIGGHSVPRLAYSHKNRPNRGDNTSIDHVTPWSELALGLNRTEVEINGHIWEITYLDEAMYVYNDGGDLKRGNLNLMRQGDNSSKGGKKGGDFQGPIYKGKAKMQEEESDLPAVSNHDFFHKKHDHFDPPPPGTGGGGIPAF